MATIELYELQGCPYCEKVTRTLDELGLAYESHYVSAAHSDREEVREISGQPEVPVLVDEEHGIEGMNESDDIVRYLETTYEDAEGAADEVADGAANVPDESGSASS